MHACINQLGQECSQVLASSGELPSHEEHAFGLFDQQAFRTSLAATRDDRPRRTDLDETTDLISVDNPAQGQICRVSTDYAPVRLSRRKWYLNLRIDFLTVDIVTFRQRNEFPFSKGVYYDISVMFYPSSRLMTLPGISLSYTNAPNQQGHTQLCPVLSHFPTIPTDAPVWAYVEEGDLDSVGKLFAQGLASPNDQNHEGWSLLMVCRYAFLVYNFLINLSGQQRTLNSRLAGSSYKLAQILTT